MRSTTQSRTAVCQRDDYSDFDYKQGAVACFHVVYWRLKAKHI